MTTDSDIKVAEDTDWKEQPAATGQGIIKLFACYEMMKEKKKFSHCQTSVLDVKVILRTCASPPVLLNTADDDADDQRAVQ